MPCRWIWRSSAVIVAATLSFLILIPQLAAESFDSLYASIEAANSSGENRTITLTQDIILSGPLPPITGTVTLEGGGHTISGDGAHRILDVAGGALRLNNLSLTGAKAPEGEFGGALRLRNGARVTIAAVTFSENSAMNGGAIATDGAGARLNITNSTFARNHASDFGGALYLKDGTADITQSSFQENRSDFYAGAIAAHDSTLTVSNSTFSNNSAAAVGGVIDVLYDEVTFTHVTIIYNLANRNSGDAIHRTGGAFNLYNSIVDGSAEMKGCTNGLTRASGNISHDGSCTLLGARAESLTGELTDSPAWFPLKDGSPALDAADPAYCLPTDQIGTPRPHGGGCDAGAIESTTALLAPTPILPPPGCPLHDAINAANRDAPSGACAAGSGHDTIRLDGDVKLREPLPPITSEITIEGNGYEISGILKYRIFDIHQGNLTINNATLSGGKATHGGAIRLRENARLTAEEVTFRGNSAEKGGAISTTTASSRATIRNSRFERNKADIYGGAIQALHGSVNISNSALLSNSAGGYGGALHVDYGDVNVSNSTFSQNSAAGGGAVSVDFGGVTLTHVTMVDDNATQNNGDAIHNYEGKVILRNSIIASDKPADDCSGGVTQSRGVVSPDGACAFRASADARLDDAVKSPLHFPLLDGSPAVDAAIAEFCPATDQIGRARPLGGGCDIGAIESASATPAEPTPAPSVCTLFDQILAFNSDRQVGQCPAGSGADTIRLTEDITLTSRLPVITSGLTIEGAGHTIGGAGRFPIFRVRGTWLRVNNLTMREGYHPRGGGGAISLLHRASAVVQDSSFVGNHAQAGGAIALYGTNNELTVSRGSFVENTAERRGGAIVLTAGSAHVESSSFVSNRGNYGGAISAEYGNELNVVNSTFNDNFAKAWGGAIEARRPSVTLTHVTMKQNSATGYSAYGDGHALWIGDRNTSFRLRNSIIAGDERTEICHGRLTQNIGNLIEDGSCSPKLSGDPLLGDLTGSLGYHPLQTGSPAINAADERFCRDSDQIGSTRPVVGACDIGAVEMPPVVEQLSGCIVTTTHGLNFRDGPSGGRIGLVPENASLAASARTEGWFNVVYEDEVGWISADYVVAEGDCG